MTIEVPRHVRWGRFSLLCLLAACAQGPKGGNPKSLVLITIDTLRADALGAYGASGLRSPRIDELARHSIVYESAYATAPVTGPSHASILTSQHPSAHGVIFNGHVQSAQLFTGGRTLAEHLRAQGYQTAAFVSVRVLDAAYGFDRGFDKFQVIDERDEGELGGSGAAATAAAASWLAAHRSGPFFLWVHYFDPHLPYASPEGIHRLLGSRPGTVSDPEDPEHPVTIEAVRAAYRAEVYEVDRQVGALLDALAGVRKRDDVVVTLTADHGEYLGEHDGSFNHSRLYDEVLHVPLMIRASPRHPPSRVSADVSSIDLVPTVLGVLGLPALPGAQGRDLLAVPRLFAKPVFSEWRYLTLLEPGRQRDPEDFLVSVRSEHWKLIQSISHPDRRWLFDLRSDPQEQHDVSASALAQRTRLKALLRAHERADLPRGILPPKAKIDAESRQLLETLGYL